MGNVRGSNDQFLNFVPDSSENHWSLYAWTDIEEKKKLDTSRD